jgi:hypothetical protein
MNWTYYETLLNQKITEAEHNFKYAEQKSREAEAVLNGVLREKEAFLEALKELMREGKQ